MIIQSKNEEVINENVKYLKKSLDMVSDNIRNGIADIKLHIGAIQNNLSGMFEVLDIYESIVEEESYKILASKKEK